MAQFNPRRILFFVVLSTILLAGLASSKGCAASTSNRNPLGEAFPSVVGESLEEESVRIPEDYAGKPTVLLVGYVQRTQFDLDRWIMGLMQAEVDAQIVEVPTIPGLMPTIASKWIDDGMRAGIPPEEWGAVVTLYGSAAKPVVDLTGNESPHRGRVLVLDPQGTVIWFSDRGYSASQALEIQSLVESIAAEL